MDKKTMLRLNYDKAFRNYKKISRQAPNVLSASDRELDAYYNSLLLAEAEVDKAFDEALNFKGE